MTINSQIADKLREYHDTHPYCENRLHISIWRYKPRAKEIVVDHAFYMNDERDLDPFYLEYDR